MLTSAHSHSPAGIPNLCCHCLPSKNQREPSPSDPSDIRASEMTDHIVAYGGQKPPEVVERLVCTIVLFLIKYSVDPTVIFVYGYRAEDPWDLAIARTRLRSEFALPRGETPCEQLR